uniref:Zinc/iron permease n=1 Tax=Spongospora subterranea TaxID=70186 RepID=A0A0H5R9E6_9EUKA|eukprot:CRZ10302.1 hypothetical protein [Spongospora subterranea]
MGSLSDLLVMALGMFFGSILPGLVPIWIGSPRQFVNTTGMMSYINGAGAGLFMGTAISVIIPEGIHMLYHDACSQGLPKSFGISIALGFAFMLVVDRLPAQEEPKKKPGSELTPLASNVGDHKSHSHSSAFIGLLVHSAADGIAMGAASLSHESSVEFMVFMALVLHKAPASFTIITHLMHQNRPKSVLIRNLILLAASAPIASICTYIMFADKEKELSQERLGILMLFSAGTFLFVAAIHILPEVIHKEGTPVSWTMIGMVILGLLLPSVVDMSHSHGATPHNFTSPEPVNPSFAVDHNIHHFK